MTRAIAFIAILALAVFIFSALMFDAPTLFFIAVAMLIVGFFSGAAVTLGVWTRHTAAKHHSSSHDEVIPHDPP